MRFFARLFTDTAQRRQCRICSYLQRWNGLLSDDERQFVALMQDKLEGGPLHENHAARLGELYVQIQGEVTW
jgi:hypothetical protein